MEMADSGQKRRMRSILTMHKMLRMLTMLFYERHPQMPWLRLVAAGRPVTDQGRPALGMGSVARVLYTRHTVYRVYSILRVLNPEAFADGEVSLCEAA